MVFYIWWMLKFRSNLWLDTILSIILVYYRVSNSSRKITFLYFSVLKWAIQSFYELGKCYIYGKLYHNNIVFNVRMVLECTYYFAINISEGCFTQDTGSFQFASSKLLIQFSFHIAWEFTISVRSLFQVVLLQIYFILIFLK